MATAEDVLEVARTWIGTEREGDNHTVFGKWFGWDGVAWCDIFVTYCFAFGGAPLPIHTASVMQSYDYARDHGLWQSAAACRPGDQIVFDWTGNKNPDTNPLSTHTGIVESNDGRTIGTIEGNTARDKVERGSWAVDNPMIAGTINWQGLFFGGGPHPLRQVYDGWPDLHQAIAGPGINGTTGRTNDPAHKVASVQNALNICLRHEGVSDPLRLHPDGDFGQATENAAKAFQGAYRIDQDGVVGADTYLRIRFTLGVLHRLPPA